MELLVPGSVTALRPGLERQPAMEMQSATE